MPAATKGPTQGAREINGRIIECESRGGAIVYRTVDRPPPFETQRLDQKTGSIVRGVVRPQQRVLWAAELDPQGTMHTLERSLCLGEFDPREPSPILDELERARAAGFEVLAAECMARLKPEPRKELPGFGLGRCYASRGARKVTNAFRDYLGRHAAGDHGTLGTSVGIEPTEDQLWCPVAFGVDVQNAVAIRSGEGIVRSIYQVDCGEKDRLEELKIFTWIGRQTIVYNPRHDATG